MDHPSDWNAVSIGSLLNVILQGFEQYEQNLPPLFWGGGILLRSHEIITELSAWVETTKGE